MKPDRPLTYDTAETLVNSVFAPSRPRFPRSRAYKAGVFAGLVNRYNQLLDNSSRTLLECPFRNTTAAADAFRSGEEEGRGIAEAFAKPALPGPRPSHTRSKL